jgi:hypothetical protein
MKKSIVFFLFVALLMGCNSSPDITNSQKIKGPYFKGDGGKNVRVAILEPDGKGLKVDELWLSPMVQGVFTSDFKKYSAMTVLDRQNMDKILDEQRLSLSGDFSDDDYIRIGNLTNAQYILVGSITKTSNNIFLLEFSITNTETGILAASYPPTMCTKNSLEDTTAIKKASEDLFAQMGVQLTDSGKQALYESNISSMDAEIALSKGIAAQRNNTFVEALSYYYEAVSFDSSLAEAKGRLSVLSSNINSGNIGQSVRNEIERKKTWTNILNECESFYRGHIPFEIIYDPKLTQERIDYQNESVSLSFSIKVAPSSTGFKILNDVFNGLNKTKKKEEWGFNQWPFNLDRGNGISDYHDPDPESSSPFYHLGDYRVYTFHRLITMTISLFNDQDIRIATHRGTLGAEIGTLGVAANDNTRDLYKDWIIRINPKKSVYTFNFDNVKANDITDNLTIRIENINGIDAETAGKNGYIKISSGKIGWWDIPLF